MQFLKPVKSFERHDGPTPSGGAYSTAYYTTADGRPCNKEEASVVCITVYSADGKRINGTVGTCRPRRLPGLLLGASGRVVLSVVVILFAAFSLAGWLYETVENVFTFGGLYLRASLMLPWCPIYGIGGLIIVAVLEPIRRRLACKVPKAVEVIAICAGIYLLATAVELGGSFACQAVMGYVPWDYSHAWLNFQGRIAPAYTLRFVVLGLIALYLVYPAVAKWAMRSSRAAGVVAIVLACLFVADCALQAAGVWQGVKDALVPFGINHW